MLATQSFSLSRTTSCAELTMRTFQFWETDSLKELTERQKIKTENNENFVSQTFLDVAANYFRKGESKLYFESNLTFIPPKDPNSVYINLTISETTPKDLLEGKLNIVSLFKNNNYNKRSCVALALLFESTLISCARLPAIRSERESFRQAYRLTAMRKTFFKHKMTSIN